MSLFSTEKEIQVEASWETILGKVEGAGHLRRIYVVGGPDTGKTSLSQHLSRRLLNRFSVSYIDCDPGQSSIGPPSTIGLEFYPARTKRPAKTVLSFVGSLSPQGHLLQTLVAIAKLVRVARKLDSEKIILDSSGFVHGPIATEFQFQLIDLIRPQLIVFLEKGKELENLYKNFVGTPGVENMRIAASSNVKPRSMVERQEYRQARFRAYFQELSLYSLNLDELGEHGRISDLMGTAELKNRLIALCDAEHFVITLGIIHKLDRARHRVFVIAPKMKPERVRSIQFGSVYLDPTLFLGEERGR